MDKKSTFIETEPLGVAGEQGEQVVWEAVKRAYSERGSLGYWRYPLFSKVGQTRKEPDILLVDQEHGVVIIEVKSFTIDTLTAVNGHRWEYKEGFYAVSNNPYQQAENHLFSLASILDREPALRRNVPGKVMIALPNITEKEWQMHGFDRLPSQPPILFKEQLGKASLLQAVQQTPELIFGDMLDEERLSIVKAILSGAAVQRKEVTQAYQDTNTRLGVIHQLSEKLYEFDVKQEVLGKMIPPGPQRIRGIAGSGKTVILCQKAAQMYLKHPDWQIALVFFSRSLYENVCSQVDKWLRQYSNGDVCYDETVKKNLKILHAWGGRDQAGFYSYVCEAHGKRALTINDIKKHGIKGIGNSIGYVCREFLTTTPNYTPLFDAVLIDEGQDLVVDEEFKFEGKQPFYWLAYEMLHPIQKKEVERRLIWAYDESQSLDNLTIPTSKELFGEDIKFQQFVAGFHKGGSRRSEIMQRCYRTPGPILTAAHAIGMGLLRPEGMLRGITNKENWRSIGYEVKSGSFRVGEEIVLYRPDENSPNLVPDLWKESVFKFTRYDTRQQEIEAVVKAVHHNITQDLLKPMQNILIIALDRQLQNAVAMALNAAGINYYIPTHSKANELECSWRNQQKNNFWHDGAVTITNVTRAKGNEAHVVYVVGADAVAKQENNAKLRNQLFVALTRSRGWAYLSGIGHYPMYDEIEEVIESGNTFTFTYQKAPLQLIDED